MVTLGLLVSVFAAFSATMDGQVQVPAVTSTVDYDTFMHQDVQGRLRVFNQITPENRAELVQTQIRRWIEKNRARLTTEQLMMMEENLAFVTADRYRLPANPENQAKAKELEARSVALFTREDIVQAMTINAAYIPKQH